MAKDKKSKKADKAEKKSKKGTTYNLHDFAKAISEDKDVDVNTGDIHKVLQSFCDSVSSHVTESHLNPGDKINFPGVGALVCVQKKPRNARNPKTGETFVSPARPAVKFKLSSHLRIWGKPVKEKPAKGDKKAKKK